MTFLKYSSIIRVGHIRKNEESKRMTKFMAVTCCLFVLNFQAVAESAWDPSQPLAGKGLELETPLEKIAAPSSETITTASYVNIRVNSDTSKELQNEEQIVVNPTDPNNVVAVWRDFRLGYRRVGYGYSNDGGYTWTDRLFEGTPYPLDSDPGLTVNSAGVFFAVILAFTTTTEPNGLLVYRSSDGGVNWEGPFTVVSGVPGVFEDKELIACDRTSGPYKNNLYVVWARFYALHLMISHSTDNGVTWSTPIRIDDSNLQQWPVCAIGPNGEVNVAWVSTSGIHFDWSLNGGTVFGRDVQVATTGRSGTLNGGIWVYAFPAMDVDISSGPNRGNIYIVFMDWASKDTDIYFVKSTDGGRTWSSRMRINDDPLGNRCDQFHPWIYVDDNGAINVIWLDRRLDPLNYLTDCYMTRSTDGGNTWSLNERISTVSSDPNAGSKAGVIGEYIGLSGTTDRINPLWTDTREGNQDAYTSVIHFPISLISTTGVTGIILLIMLVSLLTATALISR